MLLTISHYCVKDCSSIRVSDSHRFPQGENEDISVGGELATPSSGETWSSLDIIGERCRYHSRIALFDMRKDLLIYV